MTHSQHPSTLNLESNDELVPPLIGFTCSTFDLFHAGHILMLKEARSHCDYLIVGLQTDPTIDRPDTKNKPIQSIVERQIQLEACKFVDRVIVYETEKDLVDILLTLDIGVRFLGEEYRNQSFTGRNECRQRGIEFHFNRRDHSFSTTELRQRVVAAEVNRGLKG